MFTHRFRSRLTRHHLPAALVSALALAVLVPLTPSDRRVQAWSIATAYVALALLAATLVTGPYAVLKGRRHPTSNDLRRDLGIWAGGFGLAHFLIGLQVHLKHRYLYWFKEATSPGIPSPRTDPFGLANDLGVIAVVIVVVLLAISNDVSLRRLGAPRWKKIQQWNYWYLGLVILHAGIYEVLEKRKIGLVLLSLVIAGGAVAVQAAGALRRRQHSQPSLLSKREA